MEICDFSRSFITFILTDRSNYARIQVESRSVLTWPDGTSEQFLLVASCKSENTYAQKDLFKHPNYDFCGIFSDTHYRLIRVHLTSDQEGMNAGLIADRFLDVPQHLVCAKRIRPLPDKAAIVQATLDNLAIIGRTEIEHPAAGVHTMIEYPVKTMNVHPDALMFQVDTGPVLSYDFDCPNGDMIQHLRLAYVAYNQFTSADFVIQVPTPIIREGKEVAQTTHYSAIETYPDAKNSLFATQE